MSILLIVVSIMIYILIGVYVFGKRISKLEPHEYKRLDWPDWVLFEWKGIKTLWPSILWPVTLSWLLFLSVPFNKFIWLCGGVFRLGKGLTFNPPLNDTINNI